MTRKAQVNSYIKNHENARWHTLPLIFRGALGDINDNQNSLSVLSNPKSTMEEKVVAVILLSQVNFSYREQGGIHIKETRMGAYRNSLDIWRHIILFHPDVTIFEVMAALFNLSNILRGWYCSTVKRRVFWKEPTNRGYSNTDYKDEYGLYLLDWKNIHLKRKNGSI